MMAVLLLLLYENGFFWPTKTSGGLQHHKFMMENSILKIFGSMDVKITPDFCVMVDPGLFGDVQKGQLYLELDAIDVFYRF